jgi:hypothetical protein
MATQANPFDDKIKIFNYVQTLYKCCGNIDETTYRVASKNNDCKKTIASYFREETYNRTIPAPRRGGPVGAIAPQFVQAFFFALRYFKMLDPSTNTHSWDTITGAAGVPLAQALLDIVYDIRPVAGAVPAVPGAANLVQPMAGGGDDFNFSKIIKLSKNEPEGFVPYLVNNIAGSYTDEYLDKMNSKIKKHFNQFGGFKKATKDVIGSLEDLDRLLRDDMATQVNDAVFKRYYKSYPVTYQTGGVYGAHGAIVKEAYDIYRNSSAEQKTVIDCIGSFQFYAKAPMVPPGLNFSFNRTIEKMNNEDPATLGEGFIRFNLKKIQNPGGKYDKYTNLVSNVTGAVPVVGLPVRAGVGAIRSIPILLLMLPDSANYSQLLGTAFNYWYGTPGYNGVVGNHFDLEDGTAIAAGIGPFLGAIALGVLQGTVGANNIVLGCAALSSIISCDDDLYERLVKNDMPEEDDGEYQFINKYDKKFLGPNRNTYRYDDNTKNFERKRPDGTYETINLTDKKKFKEFFHTDDKCFNSYFRTTTAEVCCNAMKLLMEGKTDEFMKRVGDGNIRFGDFDESFKELNPYSVVKFLEGFKFPKLKEYSPIHGTVTKFPNYKWWVTNTLMTLPELSTPQKNAIKNIGVLENFLDMSVAFVNNNINILNPHIDAIKSSSDLDANLEKRNVHRFVLEPYSVRQARWTPLRNKIQGNMIRTNDNFRPVLPFGTLFGAQQFTAHFGGGGDKTNEVVLDDFEIRPTFASNIAEDLKTIISNLKNNNKFLRSKEMADINKQLNEYAALEVKLYERILLINKYIKIAYYMNDGERETLSDNTIKTKIAEYLEIFKDYSGKDMELKNLGSVLRNILNDKL